MRPSARIPEALAEAMASYAEKQGMSISSVYTTACHQFLAREAPGSTSPAPGTMPIVERALYEGGEVATVAKVIEHGAELMRGLRGVAEIIGKK